MKIKLSIIAVLIGCALVGISTLAQEDQSPAFVTNSVTIIVSTEVDSALRNAWRLDNNARTNGLFPYVSVQPALTLRDFREDIGRQAFEAAAVKARQQNEEFIRNNFTRATDDVQMRIVRILANKE